MTSFSEFNKNVSKDKFPKFSHCYNPVNAKFKHDKAQIKQRAIWRLHLVGTNPPPRFWAPRVVLINYSAERVDAQSGLPQTWEGVEMVESMTWCGRMAKTMYANTDNWRKNDGEIVKFREI